MHERTDPAGDQVSPMNARHSASAALRSILSGQPWFRPKAPARPIINIEEENTDTDQHHGIRTKNGPAFVCPIPIEQYPNVLLAHGGGGKLTHQLIEKMFLPAFGNPMLGARHDGAVFDLPSQKLAFTTDSYVVQPAVFPRGRYRFPGRQRHVNDLAMCGARPLYLSAGFILEEGLPMDTLWRVMQSMALAASAGRRPAGHGRHQGRGPGERGRDFHQHRRDRRRGIRPHHITRRRQTGRRHTC